MFGFPMNVTQGYVCTRGPTLYGVKAPRARARVPLWVGVPRPKKIYLMRRITFLFIKIIKLQNNQNDLFKKLLHLAEELFASEA